MAMRTTVWVIGITSLLLVSYVGATVVVDFGYSGATGPANWGTLRPEYQTCSKGTHQSPIDIVQNNCVKDPTLKPLDINYVDAKATLVDNIYNIALNFDAGVGFVTIDGNKYNLKNMHWHTPSEHTIDGVRYPIEVHLVHNSADGNTTVIAILFQYGSPDPLLSKLMPQLVEFAMEVSGGHEGTQFPLGIVEAASLIPATCKYFRYVGSLTAPPCTEKIIWNIIGEVGEMSEEQAEMLKAPLYEEFQHNSRPLQALNGRKVYLYSE